MADNLGFSGMNMSRTFPDRTQADITKEDIQALQNSSGQLYDAYEKSGDYGNNQSKSYQDFMAAKKQLYSAHESFQENAFLERAKSGGFNAWEKYHGLNQGAILAAATGDTSFVAGNPAAAQAAAAASPNVVAGGAPAGQTAAQGLQQPTANLGMGAPQQNSYQQNPYLDQQAQAITNQMNSNWSRNLAPSIRSGAMAAGGFGGSRQGVVEANGLNDLNQGLGNSLSNLYGGAWNQQQSNNLQQQNINNQSRSINNSYDLGLRSSDLGFANLDANIYQNNFGNQMTAAQFGMNAYNTMGNQNTQATNAATTVQNQPLNYFNSASDKTNGMANGYGSQTNSQNMPGNPMAGALGGAQLGQQLYNQFMGPSVQDNGYSTGTGSAYAGTTTDGVWSPNRRGM